MPSETPGHCSPSCSLPPSHIAVPQCSGWGKKEVSLEMSHVAREARCSLVCPLPPVGEMNTKKDCLGTGLCCLGGGVIQVK